LLWRPNAATKVLLGASHAFNRPTPDDIVGQKWPSNAPRFSARRATFENFGQEVTPEINQSLLFTSMMTGYKKSNTTLDPINVWTPGQFITTTGEFDHDLFSREFRLNCRLWLQAL
jgi:hypothetical protein